MKENRRTCSTCRISSKLVIFVGLQNIWLSYLKFVNLYDWFGLIVFFRAQKTSLEDPENYDDFDEDEEEDEEV